MKNTKSLIWYSFLLVLLVLGIYGLIIQTIHGHAVTGISKQVPWGIYIAAFTFFIGVSTGSTLIGFIIYVFNVEYLKPIFFRTMIVGLVSLVAAVLFLVADVGNPIRMLKVPILLRNTTSVFFYSSLSYYLFGGLMVYQFVSYIKLLKDPKNEKLNSRVRWLSIILFPLAMGIVLVPDGALFSFVKAREFWNRPLLLPHFANAAIVSAIAVISIIAYLSEKLEKVELLNFASRMLVGYLLIFLTAGVLFLDIFDILVLWYSEKPEGIEAWHSLTTSHLGFFLLNILGLVFALLILISKRGKSFPKTLYASILIILAISAYRYNLIIIGEELPLLEGQVTESYFPTLFEIFICAGVTSFIILAYHLMIKLLENKNLASSNA